jgi:GNAT superfamily N-acetyltransferase
MGFKRMTATVRGVRAGDLPTVRRILESRIRDPATSEVLAAEVAGVTDEMRRALGPRGPSRFLAAVASSGVVVGVAGMRPLAPALGVFATGERPAELVHIFVAPGFERRGFGSALISALEDRARGGGHDEVLVNSGPRYATSGWGFYDRLPGFERRGIVRDLYGPGQDAPVWGKRL